MGVAKAALQATTRYLAGYLGPKGVRANAVSAGPLKTMAAKSIPGFEVFESVWDDRSPLPWDQTNPEPVAQMVALLLSDWMPMTTGEVIHVDGGFHALAAGIPDAD
jgi:enoyl-[acyl-carrier protein] reductase I